MNWTDDTINAATTGAITLSTETIAANYSDTAANLAAADLDYLRSRAAKDYVVFNAKRQLFNEEFETHYYALESIDSLKAKYPEAQDLFARADALLEKRDAIIQQIAVTIAGNDAPSDAVLKEAREQWLQQANAVSVNSRQ